MNGAHVVALMLLFASLLSAPDLDWAVGSLGWSALGFLAGVGAGYLLWGRRKGTDDDT